MVEEFYKLNGSGIPHTDSDSSASKSPMVSVILPTYNRLNWLAESIRSVLDQTFQDFEIIVVNDGGEDVSQIIQNFNDKRLNYLQHSQNLGLSSARNTGLSIAKGKYIAYLDDDDIYHEDHLAILIGYLEDHPEMWVAYSDAIYSTLEKQGQDYVETNKEVKYSFDFDSERFLYENYIPVLCIIHRKDCLKRTGLFNPKLYRLEDWDLWMRMSRHYEFRHIKEITCEVRWRIDGSTMMSQSKEAQFFAYLNIIHKNFNLLREPIQTSVNSAINGELDNFYDAIHEKILFNNLDLVEIFGIDEINIIISQLNDLNERSNKKHSYKYLKILALLYAVEKNIHAFSEIKSKIKDIEITQEVEKEQAVQTLNAQIAEKEQALQTLYAQVAEKDQQAKTIKTQLVERKQQVETLQAQLEEKEQRVDTLQTQLEEKEQRVDTLQTQLAERDQETVELRGQLLEGERSVHVLQTQQIEKTQEILALQEKATEHEEELEGLTTQLSELEQQVSDVSIQKINIQQELSTLKDHLNQRERILQGLNSTLLEIYSSTAWKIIKSMWRIRLWLAPARSKREKLGRTVLGIFRKKETRVFREEKRTSGEPSSQPSLIKVDSLNNKSYPQAIEGDYTNQPLVSVIIPCYNDGIFLNECLNSIYNQTYKPLEIVIVNDGSTDELTNNMLNNSTLPLAKTITIKHSGPSFARNAGIKVANGKYILPLDADDKIHSTYIEKGVEILEKQETTGIVYCQAECFGNVDGRWDLPSYSLEVMLLDNVIFTSALFRKTDWQIVEGYDESLQHGMEDYDFWLSLIEIGREVVQIPEVLFYYRVRDDSRTNKFNKKIEQVQDTYLRIYRNHPRLFSKYQDEYSIRLRNALIELVFLKRRLEESRGN